MTALEEVSTQQQNKVLGVSTLAFTDRVLETNWSGKTDTTEDMIISALLEQDVDIPTASDADCERYYCLNPGRFTSDILYEVRHILLAARKSDKQQAAALSAVADEMISHLSRHPEDFAKIAQSRSDCPSREHGGNLGQIGKGSTVPEFETALARLPVGSIASTAIESRYGFNVVWIERVMPGELLPLEVVKNRIGAWLEASSWSRAMAQYLGILAGQADIQGFDFTHSDSPLVQ